MNNRIQLILRVNEQAGSEDFYKKSQELGLLAVQSFRGEQERHRAQMTGLENIAETTLKVSDVLDYLKKQTGQQRGQQGWKKKVGANGELLGELFIRHIESGLDPFIDEACRGFLDRATPQGKRGEQEVHLELVRQLIRQLVVRYEYEIALLEERAKGKANP